MTGQAHARIAHQAVQVMGGAERLARCLGTSPDQLRSWLAGKEIPRASVFFVLLDIAMQRRSSQAQDGLR